MADRRPIRMVAAAVFNVILYYYSFLRETSGGSGSNINSINVVAVNSTHPLSISVPQSIAQSKIQIHIWREYCPRPTVRLRLVGPEIYTFPIITLDSNSASLSSDNGVHELEVDIPRLHLLTGTYNVEANILRCHQDEVKTTFSKDSNTTTSTSCAFQNHNWINEISIGKFNENSHNQWSWVYCPRCDGGHRSPKCAQNGTVHKQEDYVLMDIDRETKIPVYNKLVTFLNEGTITLSTPNSLLPASDDNQGTSNVQYFNQLSNYELVCWLGDEDAKRYWHSFLNVYPLFGSRGQKPFKFKYIRLPDISEPTKYIKEMTYDKCKILFISYGLERFDAGIALGDYREEVQTLLKHIEKSHPDQTFPVWVLSPRSDTSIPEKTTGCVEATGYPDRTPDRMYNYIAEVRKIFNGTQGKFEPDSRTHFMDNSDITEAFWHIHNIVATKDSASRTSRTMEALRCMEKIAQTVKAWRSVNQIGTLNGLMKEGTLTPNDILFKDPYKWGK